KKLKELWDSNYSREHLSLCALITYFIDLEDALCSVVTSKTSLMTNLASNSLRGVLARNPVHNLSGIRQAFLPLPEFNYSKLSLSHRPSGTSNQIKIEFEFFWDDFYKAYEKIMKYLEKSELGLVGNPQHKSQPNVGYRYLRTALDTINTIRI
ncbi:MAG: hypothetical protein U1C33_06230, partial [Candidatus Cloacimonadaceae bacterium]|nr:hypothetical protein [Candidatus Cloacimonadaceae bacterium]